MCCGSAGAYRLLQTDISQSLRAAKLKTLLTRRPHAIATANIGCLIHLAEVSPVPVNHWIELLDARFSAAEALGDSAVERTMVAEGSAAAPDHRHPTRRSTNHRNDHPTPRTNRRAPGGVRTSAKIDSGD
jgi:hypothetical protein